MGNKNMEEKYIITEIVKQVCSQPCCSLLYQVNKANAEKYSTYGDAVKGIETLEEGEYQIQKIFVKK